MRVWRGVEAAPAVEGGDQPGGDLGIGAVELDRLVGEEAAAGVVKAQEVLAEGGEDGAHTVGVGHREGGVLHEALDALDSTLVLEHGLESEPFVHDQGLVLPGGVEIGQGLLAFGEAGLDDEAEGQEPVGHVVGRGELAAGEVLALRVGRPGEVGQGRVLEGAVGDGGGLDRERAVGGVVLVGGEELALEGAAEPGAGGAEGVSMPSTSITSICWPR